MHEFVAHYKWVLYVVDFVIAISLIQIADPEKVLARMPYALRVFGVYVFAIALMVAGTKSGVGRGGGIVILTVATIAYGFIVLWSVHRTQDIGWSS